MTGLGFQHLLLQVLLKSPFILQKHMGGLVGIEDRNWPSNAYSTGEPPSAPSVPVQPNEKPIQMQWEKVLWSCRNHRETIAEQRFNFFRTFKQKSICCCNQWGREGKTGQNFISIHLTEKQSSCSKLVFPCSFILKLRTFKHEGRQMRRATDDDNEVLHIITYFHSWE